MDNTDDLSNPNPSIEDECDEVSPGMLEIVKILTGVSEERESRNRDVDDLRHRLLRDKYDCQDACKGIRRNLRRHPEDLDRMCELIPTLVQCLQNRNDHPVQLVRATVCKTLGFLGDDSASLALMSRLLDRVPEVRTAAREALNKIEETRPAGIAAALVNGFDFSDEPVTWFVLEKGGVVLEGLKTVLEDYDPDVRLAGVEAAAFLVRSVFGLLEPHLRDVSDPVQNRVRKILGP